MNSSEAHDDMETVKALKNGSLEAFDIIYKKYFRKLGNYIYQLSKDSNLTEDILQDTFYILWTKRHKLKVDLSIKSFLFTIARNEFLQHSRKKSKERMFLDEMKATAYLVIHSNENNNELLAKVQKIIEELSPKCKEAFIASKFENLTYVEIADRMGISKKTVEIHISKAYSILRKKLNVLGVLLISVLSSLG